MKGVIYILGSITLLSIIGAIVYYVIKNKNEDEDLEDIECEEEII